jgi:hypothetical protein
MANILKATVGAVQEAVLVEDVKESKVTDQYGHLCDKIILHTRGDAGAPFIIDDVLIKDHKGKIRAKGLWVVLDAHGKILSGSPIAILLDYYKVKTPSELIGKRINVSYKTNGFVTAAAFNPDDAEMQK